MQDMMVEVDGWMIPKAEAEQYIKDRQELIDFMLEKARAYFADVEFAGTGSQDGEYVSARNADGEHIFVIFDPQEVLWFNAWGSDKEGYFENVLWHFNKYDYFYDEDTIIEEYPNKDFEEHDQWLAQEFEKEFNQPYRKSKYDRTI